MNITTLSMESREKLTKVCVHIIPSAVYVARHSIPDGKL